MRQNVRFIADFHFGTVYDEAGKDDFVGLRSKVKFQLIERKHTLCATEEYFAISRYTQCILIDCCQRKAVFCAIVLELLCFLIENGEPLVGDKYQFAADRGFLRIVDTIADESVLIFVEVLEVIAGRAIQVESTS